MTARNFAVSLARQQHAPPAVTKSLAHARAERASRTARRGACCVSHVYIRFNHPLNMSNLDCVIGMPDKSALEEGKRLFKLGGSRVEEL